MVKSQEDETQLMGRTLRKRWEGYFREGHRKEQGKEGDRIEYFPK